MCSSRLVCYLTYRGIPRLESWEEVKQMVDVIYICSTHINLLYMSSRRATLSAIGASVAATISGCLSIGSNNNDFPANIDDNETDESQLGPDPRIVSTQSPQPEVVSQDISGAEPDDEIMFYPEAVVQNVGPPGNVIVLVSEESFSRLPSITRDADSIIRTQELSLDTDQKHSVSYTISEPEGSPKSLFVLPLTISVNVQNNGQAGSIIVSINSESTDPLTQEITLSIGESKTVKFTRDPISPQVDWVAQAKSLTSKS